MAKKKISSDVYRSYGSSEDLTSYPRCSREFLELSGSSVIVREPDDLECLRRVDDECVNLSDDAVLLLNVRRLDGQDPKFVADMIRRRFFDRVGSVSPFDGLTDNEIFSAIKSRGIQTMSELDAYSEYLASSLGDSIAARKRAAEAVKALDKVPDDIVD